MRAPELRPLGVGEILDVAIKLYFRNAWTLIKIVSVVVIPFTILGLLVLLSSVPEGSFVSNGQIFVPTQDDVNSLMIGSFIAIAIGGIASLIATGAALRAVGDAYLGKHAEAGASLRFATRRFLSLLWVSILVIICVGLGFVALLIPGIFLLVALSVANPALMLEDIRGFKALKRSHELIKGRWWPAFGVILLGLILIPGVVAAVIGFLFDAILLNDVSSVTTNLMIGGVGDVLAGIITTPIQICVITVLYFDQRVRKEGFDLQILAQQIGSPGPAPDYYASPPTSPPPQWGAPPSNPPQSLPPNPPSSPPTPPPGP